MIAFTEGTHLLLEVITAKVIKLISLEAHSQNISDEQ